MASKITIHIENLNTNKLLQNDVFTRDELIKIKGNDDLNSELMEAEDIDIIKSEIMTDQTVKN